MPMKTIAAGLVLFLAAACAPAPPAEPPPPEPEPGTVASEFVDTHHARLEGEVVNTRGEPLPEVEVITWGLADPQRGSMSQQRALSGPDGRFTVPVGLIYMNTLADSATLAMVVRGIAFSERHPRPREGAYYTADTTVTVTVVPRGRPPHTSRVRLVMPFP
jgi:hypothetical protein